MKALIAVLLFALTVSSQAASNSQAPSGLQVTKLNFTKKFIKKRGFSGSMVSHDPPVLDNSTIMIPGGAREILLLGTRHGSAP
jgi:hypothetical protein